MWFFFLILFKCVIIYYFVKMFEKIGLNFFYGICIVFKCYFLNDINVFFVFIYGYIINNMEFE